jgi:ribonucleoside-diphosphate reductase alpha chain
MVEIGFLGMRSAGATPVALAEKMPREGAPAHFCPRCGEASFVKLEGCDSCLSCGYSKCG